MDAALLQTLQQNLQLTLPDRVTDEAVLEALTQRINQLLEQDFQGLVQLLYRLDVPEQKLRDLLRQHPDTDAAGIIAALILERQQQKIISRQAFKEQGDEQTDEERW